MRGAWHRVGPVATRGALFAAATLVLAGCGAYPGATEQGKAIHELYNRFFIAATAVFVLVEGLILWSIVRYRKRRGDNQLPPQIHGSNLLEVLWTLGPFLLVSCLFVWSLQTLNTVEAKASNPDVRMVVTAFQWQWEFTYQGEKVRVDPNRPEEDLTIKGTTSNRPVVYLPVDRTIHFELQARDVIHAFFVPEFLFKRDAIPGQRNEFDLTIDEPGEYHGQCTEYCGLYHNAMTFTIKAVPWEEYQAWLAKTKEDVEKGCPEDESPGYIAADQAAFSKPCLRAEANQAWELRFENKEPVPHNVEIFRGPDASAPRVLNTQDEIFPGPKTVTYQVPALPAGNYYYHCDAHPNSMTGTLYVR